ncbi:hypothetical protein QP185_03225 [Sphingomonas aerolata]|uniref:hypothetical protein n=1 Tax=Sphingomonas aerolata TaxID=185951 RepID=UPI002FE2430C
MDEGMLRTPSKVHATQLRFHVTKIATTRNYRHITDAGYYSDIGDLPMRMFETVTSSMLAIAAQALVVGVVISTL